MSNITYSTKNKKQILIPQGITLHPDHPDASARAAAFLMARTAVAKDRMLNGHWINVNHDHMRDRIREWGAVKRHAIESGWLEENPKYIASNLAYKLNIDPFTKSYRIAEPYRTGQFEVYTVARRRSQGESINNVEDAVTQKLIDHLPLVRLPESYVPPNYWVAYNCMRIWHGMWYAGRCEYGRFFTPFTSLPSDARLLLEADCPLVSLDICCSQPLLLGALVKKVYPLAPDVDRWIELCQQGDIYDYVQEAGRYLSREDAKIATMRLLFAKAMQMRKLAFFAFVERDFPTLARYLWETKQQGHQEVAKRLQRLESGLMIDQVADWYCDRWPNEPLVTVHDEIIVSARRENRVCGHIMKRAAKHGIVPTIRKRERGV